VIFGVTKICDLTYAFLSGLRNYTLDSFGKVLKGGICGIQWKSKIYFELSSKKLFQISKQKDPKLRMCRRLEIRVYS
jgi:hypothetical protein